MTNEYAPTPHLAPMRPSDQAEKIAPVQGWPAGIPWSLHMDAYAAYSKKWRPQPALIEGGCRGGFHVDELDELIPGWREKVSEIGKLRAEVKRLQAEVAQAGLGVPGQRVASDAWISVTERLPQHEQLVLCHGAASREPWTSIACFHRDGSFYDPEIGDELYPPTHWIPLPPPPTIARATKEQP